MISSSAGGELESCNIALYTIMTDSLHTDLMETAFFLSTSGLVT